VLKRDFKLQLTNCLSSAKSAFYSTQRYGPSADDTRWRKVVILTYIHMSLGSCVLPVILMPQIPAFMLDCCVHCKCVYVYVNCEILCRSCSRIRANRILIIERANVVSWDWFTLWLYCSSRRGWVTITFRVSRRPREMYCGHARLCVCLSAAACPHYCTDPDVTWGSGRGCPLVVHYWADLQSMLGMRCYGNIMEMRGRAQR